MPPSSIAIWATGLLPALLALTAQAGCPDWDGYDPCLGAATSTYSDADGNTYTITGGNRGPAVESLQARNGETWTRSGNGPATYWSDPVKRKGEQTWTLDPARLRKSAEPQPHSRAAGEAVSTPAGVGSGGGS